MTLPITLSPLGFGAYQLGRIAGAKYVSVGRPMPSEKEANELLNGVLDLGITLIDTAPAYGLSEERIGKYLSSRRDEYNLVTKVGELTVNGKCSFDFTNKGMRASVENSLRALKTDHVDSLLVHAPPDDLAMLHKSDAVETMLLLKEEGKTKTIGFSGKTIEAQREALLWSDVMMIEYSAANQTNMEIIKRADEQGIVVLFKKVLDSGHLEANEAIQFLIKKSPWNENHCTVIGSSRLDRMAQNARAFNV